jgi:hypothetical protein
MEYTMNISGVTHTAPVLPPQPTGTPEAAQAAQLPPEAAAEAPASAVAFEAQVSTQVMDIAQNQFEDAANQLISQMAAATGVGQNVDAFV